VLFFALLSILRVEEFECLIRRESSKRFAQWLISIDDFYDEVSVEKAIGRFGRCNTISYLW